MTQVYGQSDNNPGVVGHSTNNPGVWGHSTNSIGVSGGCDNGNGVKGFTKSQRAAVYGHNPGSGIGVRGESTNSHGVYGNSDNGNGVSGFTKSQHAAVYGTNPGSGIGVRGHSTDAYGVYGGSDNAVGVVGDTASQYSAVWGHNRGNGPGVLGSSDGDGVGVWGQSTNHWGVFAKGHQGVLGWGVTRGVVGISLESDGQGVVGGSTDGIGVRGETGSATGRGGVFFGGVDVHGDLTVYNGNKPFKIDHPLDPQNRYLLHNAVESPERKNVYDGIARLDEDGAAWVALPEWFEALNGNFRYQLTAVGRPAPNLHVAEEIYENHFKIAGGEGGTTVCWQVTGSRKDLWAAANPFVVEEEKPQEERGRYLQPDLYDAPEEQSVKRARIGEERPWQMMRQEPPQPLQFPPTPAFEPPQEPAMPPEYGLEGNLLRQMNELRQQIEELKAARVEDERQRQIDELKRKIEELRRR